MPVARTLLAAALLLGCPEPATGVASVPARGGAADGSAPGDPAEDLGPVDFGSVPDFSSDAGWLEQDPALPALDAALVTFDAALPELDAEAPDTVRYRLTWRTEGAERTAEGWVVESDLGYRVTLSEGWLVTHSVQLVPCQTAMRQERSWLRFLGIGTAWAGHGGDLDPAAVDDPYVESLLDADEPLLFGFREMPGTSYCRVHYLAGHAMDRTVRNLPEAPDLLGTSLWLRGAWSRGGRSGAVEVTTGLAYGGFRDLAEAPAEPPFELTSGAEVVVERDLAGLFDGVALDAVEPEALGRAVLRNLVVGAVFYTRPDD